MIKTLTTLTLLLLCFNSFANTGKYTAAGIKNDAEFERFFQSIQQNIRINDSVALSKKIEYPMTIFINGKPNKIDRPQNFISEYDRLFTADLKTVLLCHKVEDLTVNNKGVSTSRGAMRMNLAFQKAPSEYDALVHADRSNRDFWQLKINTVIVSVMTKIVAKRCTKQKESPVKDSADCTKTAITQRQMNQCLHKKNQKSQQMLDSLIAQLKERLPAAPEASLDKAQIAWQEMVENDCAIESWHADGGSASPMVAAACRNSHNRLRIDQIRVYFCHPMKANCKPSQQYQAFLEATK